jgi:WhiB family redox-sensing transcriptional regulator
MTIQRARAFPQVLEWDGPDVFEYLISSLRPEWMSEGACRGKSDLMHPSEAFGVKIAKQVCAECPVRSECLQYALEENIDHGVWGGASERQRRKMRREIRVA